MEPDHGPAQAPGETPSRMPSCLARLAQDLGDVDAVAEVVRIYLAELPARVELLDAASGADAESRLLTAHSLRSSSTLLGLDDLAGPCREMEDQLDAGSVPDPALHERIVSESARAESTLAAWLDAR